MITYNDVVNYISKLLSTKFVNYEIYTDEIIEDMKRPAFHINLLPEQSINFNSYYREENCMIDISYFSDESVDLQSKEINFNMLHQLQNIFNMNILVKDRNLNIENLTFDIIDKILHITFNLMWYNENMVTLDYLSQFEIMKVFYIDNEIIDCKNIITTKNGDIYKSLDENLYTQCTDDEVKTLKENNLLGGN